MKRLLVLTLCVLLVLTFTGCGQKDAQTQAPAVEKFSIGAASPGGGFYMGGSALASLINNKIEGMEATVESTGGSRNNVGLVQVGEIKIGLSATETAWEAYNGKFGFDGKTHGKLRTLLAGWPSVYCFVTLEKNGINSPKDFEGKVFSGGQKGSACEGFSTRAFDALGIKPEFVNLPTSDASRALGDGTIDGFTISLPSSAVQELEATHKLRIITLNQDEKAQFAQKYPQYVWLPIPPGACKALPDGGENYGLYNLFLISSEASEDFVYNIVKTAHENYDYIKDVFPNMAKGMRLENIKYTTIPYHKGAIKYFKEKGVDVPEKLVP